MAAEDESRSLEYTSTWIVASVCSVIVLVSFAAERGLHRLGKVLTMWWTFCFFYGSIWQSPPLSSNGYNSLLRLGSLISGALSSRMDITLSNIIFFSSFKESLYYTTFFFLSIIFFPSFKRFQTLDH